MALSTLKSPGDDPVIQFSLFVANTLGRLHDFAGLLQRHGVHVLGITVLDTTDSAIVRVVVDDPDRARDLFVEHGFPFTETGILVVEVDVETRMDKALSALLEAEINIHYLYALLVLPAGRPLLALNLEDLDVASDALRRHSFRVLGQGDLSR